MLNKKNTVLVVVDVQGRLAQMMHNKEALFDNIGILVQGAKVMDIPVILLEQNPKGLGSTIEELKDHMQILIQ